MASLSVMGKDGIESIKSRNFNLIATFAEAVRGFDSSDIVLEAVDAPDTVHNNGVGGVVHWVTGNGANYHIIFHLPDDVDGKFRIRFTGQVVPESSITSENEMGTAETITSEDIVITYDSISSLHVQFGDLSYLDDRVIELPIHFDEHVDHFHKTDCELKKMFGDDIFDMEYFLTGPYPNDHPTNPDDFVMTFIPEPNRRGGFFIDITGYIFKTSSIIRDNIVVTRKFIPYNTYETYMVNANIPDELSAGTWDIFVELNTPAIGVLISDFRLEFVGELPSGFEDGIRLYHALSLDVVPERPSPPSDPNNPPECIGDWVLYDGSSGGTQMQAKYYILRFNVPSSLAGKILSITPKPIIGKPPIPGM